MTRSSHTEGVAIIGIGESELGRLPNYSSHGLLAMAANKAIADAGIEKAEIDGLVTCDSYAEPKTRHGINFAQYLGLRSDRVKYVLCNPHGSAGASGGCLADAIMLIRSGVCETVLVVSGDTNYSNRQKIRTRIANTRDGEFEAVYGTFIPACFGMAANRYMHDYGITEEDLAEIPVAQRQWCALTDNGYLRDTPITKDDVLNSPMAATPNRMLNCAVFTDGACAFIVTTSERAKAWGEKAVTVLAAEQLFGSGTGFVTDDISTVTSLFNIREGARVSVNRAYAKTGLNANTVDLFYSYDPFSFVPVMYFEALGLCGDGEGGDFVRDGNVAPGGSVWANTHGGLCAFGQPGVGGGTLHLIEACKQLRHEAGRRQKPDAQTAIYVGEGANWSTYPVTILLRGQP